MFTLQSRHRLDIRLRHFAYALVAGVWAREPERLSKRLETGWSRAGEGLACRSVRSGFHLLLDSLALPAGTEVLVSAVTHPDMVRILEAHGLVAVPVDLDIATLAPRLDLAERLVTPRTSAMLVAHLFGGRVDMNPLADFAKGHRLLLWEDCAQAFTGPRDARLARVTRPGESLGAVLPEQQPVPLRKVRERIHIHATAEEVRHQHGRGARCDQPLGEVQPGRERRNVEIDRHRDQSVCLQDADHVRVGHRGDKDLGPGRQGERVQEKVEARPDGAAGQALACPRPARFEPFAQPLRFAGPDAGDQRIGEVTQADVEPVTGLESEHGRQPRPWRVSESVPFESHLMRPARARR